VIFQLIGTVLLVTSVLIVSRSLRNPADPIVPYAMLRAGIGGTIGVLAIMRWFSDYLDNHATRLILGWGLLAFTIVHLAGIVVARGREGLQLGGLITSALTVVLGIILLTGKDDTSGGRLNLFGTILLVFGVLLLAFAYYLYQKKDETPAAAEVPEDVATP
jgi:cbb3-type cytochrome oxidase subunit 3